MKQKIAIFTIILFSIIFSSITIYAQTTDYPQVIQPLSEESLQNLFAEFKILNNGTVCNSLDKYGFISAGVCQAGWIVRKEITNKDAIIEIVKETIVKNSKFTGVTDKSQLVVERVDELPGCILCDGSQSDMKNIQMRVIFKNQIFNGLEVEDTKITAFSDVEKNYRIDEHWYPAIELPEAVLNEKQAKNRLIGKELTYSDIAGKSVSYTIIEEDLTGNAEKVILPKYSASNIELRLAWKVPIGEHTFWHIYVDAVTGEELKTQQMFMTAAGGPPQRTIKNQTINNTNQNTNIPKTEDGNYLYWLLGILFVVFVIIILFFLFKKKQKIFLSLLFLIFLSLFCFVSAEETSKYDSITVKFIDSLSLNPIINSEITVYPEGRYQESKIYTTNSEGKIVIPVEAESYDLRSDKGDNIHYINKGGSVLISTLDKPEFTFYMDPIFDIEVDLKTDFNFLLGFFRMFRYGAYVQMPSSELNTEGQIEPSCFMQTFDKGETISQYSSKLKLRAYHSRDPNSPTDKPIKCSIYAWEQIRKVAGLKEIDFSRLSKSEVNEIELPLDEDYDSVIKKLSYDNNCQTDFKMQYVYIYETEDHKPENLERLERQKDLFEQVYNKAGRFKTTIDTSLPIYTLGLNDSNRAEFTYSDQYNPIPHIKVQELMQEYYKTNPDNIDLVVIFSNFHAFNEARMMMHGTIISNIEGIGRDLWDQSEYYGSNGKLLGWIYEGDLNYIYSDKALGEFNENEITCMLASQQLHETTHQWAAYLGNEYGKGGLELQVSGGPGHWFQGLDGGFDPVGGWEWINNGGVSFTTAEPTEYCATKDPSVPQRFAIDKMSDLTLYLMGAIDEYSVEPILWVNYSGVLEPGITVQADSKYITIQDIINEEGERVCK